MKIGEVSKRSGVSVETLRFYEREGLLTNPKRSCTGHRLYNDSIMDEIKFIHRAQDLGFSLDEIKVLKDNYYEGCVNDLNRNTICKIKQLKRKLKILGKFEKELMALL